MSSATSSVFHHDRLKTDNGWTLIAGTGKRPMVPPNPRRRDASLFGDAA